MVLDMFVAGWWFSIFATLLIQQMILSSTGK
jgi:hypothetical protein